MDTVPAATVVEAVRLRLLPLQVEHAVEMAEVLADQAIYTFIGGGPPTVDELRRRYTMQVVGHDAAASQWWLNWHVQVRTPPALVGFVQATVSAGSDPEAALAWVIGPRWQGQGLATEAASAMVGWLREHGVHRFLAWVHPDHAASESVAHHLGLHRTETTVDGEQRWQSRPP